MSIDFLAAIVAFLLTVMIFSYLVGDNPAFRIAVYIFVGVTAGYVAAVAWWQVLLPDLILPLIAGTAATRAMLAVPLLLSGMVLMKAWPLPFEIGCARNGVCGRSLCGCDWRRHPGYAATGPGNPGCC
jgi:hypothetical protein